MATDKNRNSVLRQLAALQEMNENELREKWRDLYGSEPPQYRKPFLVKRLSFRVQELFYGGISDGVQEALTKIASNDPLVNCLQSNAEKKQVGRRSRVKTGVPVSGTRFIREWNGGRYEIVVRDDGFEYNDRMFRSLSAVATEITGTRWNGKVFFGLKRR